MPAYLPLEGWKRRSHFEFFRAYQQPFFNVCVELEVGSLREHCRGSGSPSFFLASLYLSLLAANETEELRYRLRGEQVLVHDVIHGGSTFLRDDETFAFAYFEHEDRFSDFARRAAPVAAAARVSTGAIEARPERDDLIHYSVLPWISFTSFAHARASGSEDSVPKIVFGRVHEVEGRARMPVSVEVHHALVDGLHVGRFLERFQHHLDTLPLD